MNTSIVSIPCIEALNLSKSKLGYIIANKKNLEKLLTLSFIQVRSEHFSEHFSGMVDGMMPVENSLEEAKAVARQIINARRFGRGIAVYGADASTRGLPSVSVGDCCYDVTFYLPA